MGSVSAGVYRYFDLGVEGSPPLDEAVAINWFLWSLPSGSALRSIGGFFAS
jgi:hypothetical protein